MSRKEVFDKMRRICEDPNLVRNISVIAHVDAGKSTLTDSLISAAGLMNSAKAGHTLVTDTGVEEKARGITIKSTGICLPFTRKKQPANPRFNPNWPAPRQEQEQQEEQEEESMLVNVIDSPGHIEFSSEVSAALRLSDGAIVVLDCVEGVCAQTKTVLRQAIAERVKPVVFLNKLDRMFLELNASSEDIYQDLRKHIENVNVIVSSVTPENDPLGDVTVYPQNGSVAFGSAKQGWAFTLEHFARMYQDKFDMPVKKIMKKLWGDHYYSAKLKKFTTEPPSSQTPRAFCQFVLEPLKRLFSAIQEDKRAVYAPMLEKVGVLAHVEKDAKDWESLNAKSRIERVMRKWLPCSSTLRDLVCDKLPSPTQAQKYRVLNLYDGPQDDAMAAAIRQCDPKGPVTVFVSKMIPTSDNSRFYGYGRVYSGTLRAGEVVRVQGPDYRPGEQPRDVTEQRVAGMYVMMADEPLSASQAPCGSIVAISGLDKFLVKNGTLTSLSLESPYNFACMKLSVSCVVRVAVECVKQDNLPKLAKGLARLARSDPLIQVYSNSSTGQTVIAGSGELHLEVCLNALRRDFLKGVEIRVSEPVVEYCETVLSESKHAVIGKAPNKLNRITLTAEPLSNELCEAIEKGQLDVRNNEEMKTRAQFLVKEHKWDVTDARRILSLGGDDDRNSSGNSGVGAVSKANILVDQTHGVAYLHEIKDTLIQSFKEFTLGGIFANERVRGMRVNVVDAKIHSDPAHRGVAQIRPAMRDALFACQINSQPAMLEPVYVCDIVSSQESISGAFQVLRKRRSEIVGTEDVKTSVSVKAFVPVVESFGLVQELRGATQGDAFPQLMFSHWSAVPGQISHSHSQGDKDKKNSDKDKNSDSDSMATQVVMAIRKRKSLKLVLPQLSDYHSKI